MAEPKVSVLYYLSKDGQLEHPHFIQVPLSSSSGLFLRDFVYRLNLLRGHGMPYMYSWSSKRRYQKGFVWQDLSEEDFIYPSHGDEYILKGSKIPETPMSFRFSETASSEINGSGEGSSFAVRSRGIEPSRSESSEGDRREEYRVETAVVKSAADAATQTGEERRQNRGGGAAAAAVEMRLRRDEVSPPPDSDSGSGRFVGLVGSTENGGSADVRDRTAGNDRPSGRIKASAVVMQLISCGSTRVVDWESTERSSSS